LLNFAHVFKMIVLFLAEGWSSPGNTGFFWFKCAHVFEMLGQIVFLLLWYNVYEVFGQVVLFWQRGDPVLEIGGFSLVQM
jgi:hypothetical protein